MPCEVLSRLINGVLSQCTTLLHNTTYYICCLYESIADFLLAWKSVGVAWGQAEDNETPCSLLAGSNPACRASKCVNDLFLGLVHSKCLALIDCHL
jgi:hypothetical protein